MHNTVGGVGQGWNGPTTIVGTVTRAQATPPVASTIRDLTSRIDKVRHELETQGYRAKTIADCYFGANPEKEETGGLDRPTETHVQALEYEALKLEQALNLITIQLDRLSCI